ncbi:Unknown protein, partial [Striga hermonthica]
PRSLFLVHKETSLASILDALGLSSHNPRVAAYRCLHPKGLIIIDSLFLSETLRNQPCFEGNNLPVRSSLTPIDPFAPNGFLAFRKVPKVVDIHSIYRFNLRIHRFLPRFCIYVLDCLIVGPGVTIMLVTWDE